MGNQVKWQRVPELISQRKVFVRAGMAWVPMKEQASLVVAEFQSKLTRDLEVSFLKVSFDTKISFFPKKPFFFLLPISLSLR